MHARQSGEGGFEIDIIDKCERVALQAASTCTELCNTRFGARTRAEERSN